MLNTILFQKVGLQIEDWERDVVYLVQFPPSPKSRTISPFSLKLESWLRLHKIKYRNVYSLKFSAKGQIPYIELNGKEVLDNSLLWIQRKKFVANNDSSSRSPIRTSSSKN